MTRSENAILRAGLRYSGFLSSKVPPFVDWLYPEKSNPKRPLLVGHHIVIDWIVRVLARRVNVL
jgi:hypothetical protein